MYIDETTEPHEGANRPRQSGEAMIDDICQDPDDEPADPRAAGQRGSHLYRPLQPRGLQQTQPGWAHFWVNFWEPPTRRIKYN